MISMRFVSKRRCWIKECLSSATVSVLINGNPIREFTMRKGLRQRDPLFPFLFLLLSEALHLLINKAADFHMIKGFSSISPELSISHLRFADDTILFLDDIEAAKNMINVLWCFEVCSGLSINFSKSLLLALVLMTDWWGKSFGVDDRLVRSLADYYRVRFKLPQWKLSWVMGSGHTTLTNYIDSNKD